MKTFFFLFCIAISLPSEAQRVRESVKQKIAVSSEMGLPKDLQEKPAQPAQPAAPAVKAVKKK